MKSKWLVVDLSTGEIKSASHSPMAAETSATALNSGLFVNGQRTASPVHEVVTPKEFKLLLRDTNLRLTALQGRVRVEALRHEALRQKETHEEEASEES